MEPNISFQKNALMPILAIEAYYRKNPTLVKEAVIVNGYRFKENPYFMNSVAPNLTIMKAGLLQLMPRAHITNFARAYPDAIVVQHQVNNAYNYSFLEWITMGFPVLHNIPLFKDFGYYYEGNDFLGAASTIETIINHHDLNVETHRAHARHPIQHRVLHGAYFQTPSGMMHDGDTKSTSQLTMPSERGSKTQSF
jgi:hypothetical protein